MSLYFIPPSGRTDKGPLDKTLGIPQSLGAAERGRVGDPEPVVPEHDTPNQSLCA
jgi:hypothetical protein